MSTHFRLSAALTALLFVSIPAAATTYTVTNTADSGAGSLRQAVIDANANAGADTIDLTGVSGTITLTTGELLITDSVTITGPGTATLAVNGNNQSRIFDIDAPGMGVNLISVTVTGLTLRNGATNGADRGGAILSSDSDLTLNNVVVKDSVSGDNGGGICFLANGSLSISNATISGNTAENGDCMTIGDAGGGRGGGVYVEDATTATFNNVTITNNGARFDGGGLALVLIQAASTVSINNCTISGNTSVTSPACYSASGGGLFVLGGNVFTGIDDDTVTVQNTTISGNHAAAGNAGGVDFGDVATATIKTSTISGNTATGGDAGGLLIAKTNVTIENVTVSGNTATARGGAMLIDSNSGKTTTIRHTTINNNHVGSASSGGVHATNATTVTLRNSIVANSDFTATSNAAPDLVNDGTSSFTVSYSDVENSGSATVTNGGGNLALDPQLGALQNNGGPTQTHKPSSGSPVIDAGDPAFTPPPSTEQRGFARVVNSRIDMGSVELETVAGAGTLSFSPTTYNVAENAAAGKVTLTVTRTGGSTGAVSVDYATSDGLATAGSDYTTTTGTLNWADGDSSPKTIDVPIADDTIYEGDETFTVTLTNATGGAATGSDTATVTITENDTAPSLSIDSVSHLEGNSGTTSYTFTVTLSAAAGQNVTVDYATANGTATAGSDYTATSGTLTFTPGVTSQPITVAVNGDTANETDETFSVVLSNPVNATIATGTGTGTIRNDDAQPSISIDNVSKFEGNSGTTGFDFTVTLSAASGQTVTAQYATSDGTATAGSDYTAASGTVTFAPGTTSQQVSISVNGDTTIEPDETFTVTLSSPSNATLGTSTATGTILNDDAATPTLFIDDVTQLEGDSGTTSFVFNVTLSPASLSLVTVDYTTTPGTAHDGSDYGGTTGTLFFTAGQTSKQIVVNVNGDTGLEPDETFTVDLSNAMNAAIGKASGTGTILNDDTTPVVPAITIGDVSQNEGDSGTTDMTFTVTLSEETTNTVTVNYASADGSATAGSDYTAVSGTLTFNPGETSKDIVVPINGDTTIEPDENFTISLSNESNATIANGTGTGTIINDDLPVASIDDVTQVEGDSGTSNFIFTVTLSAPASDSVQISYITNDGTATASSDYTGDSGFITFDPGETSKQISISVNGDTTLEPDETFTVDLMNPEGAVLGKSSGVGTIQNDDALLSIDSVSKAEGNSGTTSFDFTVTLSAAMADPVTVNYTTADGTATAGSDYTTTAGFVTFDPGQTSKQISVPVNGDTTYEPDETFTVTLSSPSNATISSGTGTGTIQNDDAQPAVSIGNVSQAEGDSGTTNVAFDVTLSNDSAQTVTVNYATTDGTALAGSDYTAASGTLTFNPGETSKQILVAVNGDTAYEPDETFTVGLSSPVNATLGTATGTGTIQNDDAQPAVSIANVSQAEGNSGTTNFAFDVTLSNASYQTVTVNYATADGTAAAGSDYASASGTLTFNPGETSKQVVVAVNGDTTYEPDETFTVGLSPPVNATLGTATGTGTIQNDDAQPSVSIANVSQAEGNSGTTNFAFDVALSNASYQTVTVNYATADGTAAAGSDYASASGNVTFNPGETSKQIVVAVNGDTAYEPDETFTVGLSSPVNATLGTATGTGTIQNDDAQPSVSIDSVSQAEGNSGTTSFTFTVSLSGASSQAITVNYATADGTAIAGSDYSAASGTVTFNPGETSKPVVVSVTGDTTFEPNETFTAVLSSPSNAILGTATGTGTIQNDDAQPSVSIGNASQAEGNSGTTNFNFDVTLSNASSQTITVQYASADGTAAAGSDYSAASGTVTFNPGEVAKQIAVAVNGDTAFEANETFTVGLSSPVNAILGTSTGTGTIQNDDAQPAVSIANVSQAEGNSGTTNFNFDVTLSNASSQTITVQYATADGTAIAGIDYTAASGSITFNPGETAKQIAIAVNGDTTTEPNETFTVTVSSPSNATIGSGTATGTIQNDDGVPTISIANVSQAEGNSGTANFTFDVTLSAPSAQTITVSYATADGTATAGSDYTATNGTLTFNPGETSKQIVVTVSGDTMFEADETFTVALSNPTNAAVATPSATGTIQNDDAQPSIAIADAAQAEGNSGTTSFIFNVTLSNASSQTVTVNYATADGTAIAGNDYVAASGTVTFNAGETSKPVTITVFGDTTAEPNETFTVALSAPSNATIGTATATGTIQNDDGVPTISIANVSQAEGDSGTTNFTFNVTLSGPSAQTITVDYATADGTATAGSDYTAASGTLTFNPGETAKNIVVAVAGDTTLEPDETFTVALSNPANAAVATPSATGTIVNDDGTPALSIGNVSQPEGNSGTTAFAFDVTLSHPSSQTITVAYATADGTALAGSDYTAASGTLTFNPGETSKQIVVAVLGDAIVEPNETFTVALSSPSNATIATASGTGTIVNDDGTPALAISSVSQPEGNSGTTVFAFNVTLSAASAQTVTVAYATADGTASAGSDYTPASGTLTFDPGETSKQIVVAVLGDATVEPNETFTVTLSSPSNATIATATGTGTIQNDDGTPAISISDVGQAEGDSGTTNVAFNVTLSNASSQTITVNYATADGTASAGSDYTAASGTLTFNPGETSKQIVVAVLGDTTVEPNETFTVTLSSPANATIANATATGTIQNDDGVPTISVANVSQAEGNSGTTNFSFSVTLSAASAQTATVDYATANGTAIAASDYTAVSGTVTFNPGETSKQIVVPVTGDTMFEADETFTVALTNPVNAAVATPSATGTIVNDDGMPSLAINSVSQTEGNSGATNFVFTVTLSNASSQSVTAGYATANGTAVAGSDYTAASGTLTFNPGETSKQIVVAVLGDTTVEPDETFTVMLSGATNATIATATGTGTIRNDDSAVAVPSITIDNVTVGEAAGSAAFHVRLSQASATTVTVNYLTIDGEALAGSDYVATAGTLTFAPGITTRTVLVPVIDDTISEPTEHFSLRLSNAQNATIADNRGVATIIDDDAAPSVTLTGTSVREGDSGHRDALVTVRLSAPSAQPVSIDYHTADGTATAGSDYIATSGTLTFAPGETEKTIAISILGDTVIEPDETFTVFAGTQSATITILNDDAFQIVPVAGATDGAFGSHYRTSAQLYNAHGTAISGTIVFHPQGREGSASDPSLTFTLAAGETRSIDDLLSAIGTTGLGSADIIPASGGAPEAVFRVFNDAGADGTSGLMLQPVSSDDALYAGQRAVLITPADPAHQRFNIGVRTLAGGADITFTLRDASGRTLATQTRTYGATYFSQSAADALLGIAPPAGASIAVDVTRGAAVVYGSAVDNRTQDPSVQLAQTQPSDPSRVFPVAGATAGAHGAFFRTLVQLHNAGEGAMTGRLVFHAQGAQGRDDDPSATYSLAPGETRSLADVVATLGQSGIGSLDVVATTGAVPIAIANVFNDAGERGTSGVTIASIGSDDVLTAGTSGVLFVPSDPSKLRLNIGIRSLRDGVTLTVTTRAPDATTRSTRTISYAPQTMVQLPAADLLGIAPSGGESLTFSVGAGSAIVYGSSIDNITNDSGVQVAHP